MASKKITLSKSFSLPADLKREGAIWAMPQKHFVVIFSTISTQQECVYIWQVKKRAKLGIWYVNISYFFYSQKKSESMLFKTTFKWSLRLAIPLLSKKNGCKIKPISKFVNFWLKTQLTGNGWPMISSIFCSISWLSFKITKICFLRRLDWNFCPACIGTACKKSDSSSHCRSK